MADGKKISSISIKKAYSKLSRVYWIFERYFQGKIRKQALNSLDIHKKHIILEIGFGTGYGLTEIIRLVGKTGKVYGIDISPEMVNAAKKRLMKKGYEKNIHLSVGDAKKLEFKNRIFDRVYISEVLEIYNEKDIRIILKEIKRVLKRDGKVCAVDTPKKDKQIIRFYEWLHSKFPAYTGTGIDLEKNMKKTGFKILSSKESKILMVFPMKIVVGKTS